MQLESVLLPTGGSKVAKGDGIPRSTTSPVFGEPQIQATLGIEHRGTSPVVEFRLPR